jgi:hypothetical protein
MSTNNSHHSRFFWRSSAMFGILDTDRQFKEINNAWENTLGLSDGQLLAKCFLILFILMINLLVNIILTN